MIGGSRSAPGSAEAMKTTSCYKKVFGQSCFQQQTLCWNEIKFRL
jgi:hypothetical protein